MKKIVSLILTLALLASVFAVLPVMATNGETSLVATDISFADGVLLNFYIEADGEVTNAETVTKDGKECYKITVPVSAKEMGDDTTAQLKNGNASVGEAYTSSVKSAATTLLSSITDEATKNLVSAMLNYGAAAQKYFGYKTDALVGTPVSDMGALNAATAQSASVTDPDNVYVGASLVLEGELTLRFYFKGDVAVSKDGESLTTATKGAFTYADVTVAPDKLGEQITVSAGSATVTYSPLNYLKSKASDTALSEMAASIYAYGIAAEEYAAQSVAAEQERVLLVSLDGLRPDTVAQTKYLDMLKAVGAYTLSAQTINPSLTLPAHMSMLHSVTPTTHGVTTNEQTPAYSGNGITETLAEAGLTSAIFYDWRELEALTKAPDGVTRNYVTPDSNYKASVATLCNKVIDHVENSPTDFTFLYFGHTDCIGEKSGFTSSEYLTAVKYVFENLFTVLNSLPDGYTVIITSDHGGHNRTHGYTVPEDMYIPVFIIGDGFEAGASLREGISILDIAPTVVDLLGVDAEDYWVGQSLVSDETQAREDVATDLFLSKDAFSNYNYGTIKNTTVNKDSVTVEVQGSAMTGMQITKAAISEMISLGFRYLSFTVEYGKVSGGNTPSYADVYTYKYNKDYNFHVSTPDSESPQDPGECYYASGREIIVDLFVLYQRLSTEHGLIFILSDGLYWKPTKGGKITFSNVKFTTKLD